MEKEKCCPWYYLRIKTNYNYPNLNRTIEKFIMDVFKIQLELKNKIIKDLQTILPEKG